jgi:hypothetical protein
MQEYPSPKTNEVLNRVKTFIEGIEMSKQRAALNYAKDNEPKQRDEYLKYEYAEQQARAIYTLVERGLVAVFHETNDFIADAVKNNRN